MLQAAIADSVWVALLVFVMRLAAIMAGSWTGCRAGGVKSETQQRVFWMSMVTQVHWAVVHSRRRHCTDSAVLQADVQHATSHTAPAAACL